MNKLYHSTSGRVSLEIRDEGMSAWITINDRASLIDELEILQLIDEAGIKTGFEDAQHYIREHNLEKDFNVAFPVAICKAAPDDPKLKLFFDEAISAQIRRGIDLSRLSTYSYVEADTVVASFSSNLFDRQGSIYNVFGEIIPSTELDPEEAGNRVGAGVRFDALKNAFVADITGYPYLDEKGRICILDTLFISPEKLEPGQILHIPVNVQIEGDVKEAHLCCRGKLLINGSAISSRLVSTGDMDISGDVSASELYSESSLRVDGHISSCTGNGITVLEDIMCSAIESSLVLCRGKLALTGRISDSLVIADSALEGSSTSSIIQSHIQSCGSITTGSLGEVDGNGNELEITISPYYKTLLTRYTKELIKLKDGPEQHDEEIIALKERIADCEAQLDKELNSFLKRDIGQRFHIEISGDVHPPANIRILKHSYTIKSYQNGLNLEEKD